MSSPGVDRCTLPRLLSILLVTSSSRGQNLVFRYPPDPTRGADETSGVHMSTFPGPGGKRKYHRQTVETGNSHADLLPSTKQGNIKNGQSGSPEGNVNASINTSSAPVSAFLMPRPISEYALSNNHAYKHNGGQHHTSASLNVTPKIGMAGVVSGTGTNGTSSSNNIGNGATFEPLFGYSSEFLASMLSPEAMMCDQPFILKIDDLVFQGFPSLLPQSRNDSSILQNTPAEDYGQTNEQFERIDSTKSPIQMFHLCFVTTVGRSAALYKQSAVTPGLESSSHARLNSTPQLCNTENHKLYIDLIKQLTAALVHEEVRCGFLSTQVENMLNIHHTVLEEVKAKGKTYGHCNDNTLTSEDVATKSLDTGVRTVMNDHHINDEPGSAIDLDMGPDVSADSGLLDTASPTAGLASLEVELLSESEGLVFRNSTDLSLTGIAGDKSNITRSSLDTGIVNETDSSVPQTGHSTYYSSSPKGSQIDLVGARSETLSERLINGCLLADHLRYVFNCLTGSEICNTSLHTLPHSCQTLHNVVVQFNLNNWISISWTLQEHLNSHVPEYSDITRNGDVRSKNSIVSSVAGCAAGVGVWDSPVSQFDDVSLSDNDENGDLSSVAYCTINERTNENKRLDSTPGQSELFPVAVPIVCSYDSFGGCPMPLNRNPINDSRNVRQSHHDKIQMTFRPYHTLLLYSSSNSRLVSTLPRDCSPALLGLIKVCSPLKSFSDLARDLDTPIAHVYRLAAHLVFWRKAKIIHKIARTSVFIINPECSLDDCVYEQGLYGDNVNCDTAHNSTARTNDLEPNVDCSDGSYSPTETGGKEQGLGYEFGRTFPSKCLLRELCHFNTPCQLGDYLYMTTYANKSTSNSGLAVSNPRVQTLNGHSSAHSETVTTQQLHPRTNTHVHVRNVPGNSISIAATYQRTSVNVVVWLIRRNLLIELHNYLYLVVPRHQTAINGLNAVSGTFKSGTKVDATAESPSIAHLDCRSKAILLKSITPWELEVILSIPAAAEVEKLANFARISPYIRGKNHFADILWYENMERSLLNSILSDFSDVLCICQRPP
eukprot:CFRG4258T1